jgi:primosomal replication protein N
MGIDRTQLVTGRCKHNLLKTSSLGAMFGIVKNVLYLCFRSFPRQVVEDFSINHKSIIMVNLKNRVQLIGTVTSKKVADAYAGRIKVRFSIKVHTTFRNEQGIEASEKQEYPVESWSTPATFIDQYVKVDDRIAIEGVLLPDGIIQCNEVLILTKTKRDA